MINPVDDVYMAIAKADFGGDVNLKDVVPWYAYYRAIQICWDNWITGKAHKLIAILIPVTGHNQA